MYQFESRVRYSESDAEARLTLLGILDYFQDCAIYHSEEVGVGIQYLKEKNIAWVLLSWQIIVDRYPNHGEYIVIKTMPYDIKGCFGYRNFVMETKEGERLAYANSTWSLVDISNNTPVKAEEEMIAAYGLDEKYEMDYAPRKIKLVGEMIDKSPIEVMEYHLDTNMHVNNSQYTRIALQYLPKGKTVRQLRAEYKTQARLSDIMIPKVGMEEDKLVVSINDEAGKAYAVVELC